MAGRDDDRGEARDDEPAAERDEPVSGVVAAESRPRCGERCERCRCGQREQEREEGEPAVACAEPGEKRVLEVARGESMSPDARVVAGKEWLGAGRDRHR